MHLFAFEYRTHPSWLDRLTPWLRHYYIIHRWHRILMLSPLWQSSHLYRNLWHPEQPAAACKKLDKPEKVLKAADKVLYKVKHLGRNWVQIK